MAQSKGACEAVGKVVGQFIRHGGPGWADEAAREQAAASLQALLGVIPTLSGHCCRLIFKGVLDELTTDAVQSEVTCGEVGVAIARIIRRRGPIWLAGAAREQAAQVVEGIARVWRQMENQCASEIFLGVVDGLTT